jgi:hypothetical protein
VHRARGGNARNPILQEMKRTFGYFYHLTGYNRIFTCDMSFLSFESLCSVPASLLYLYVRLPTPCQLKKSKYMDGTSRSLFGIGNHLI